MNRLAALVLAVFPLVALAADPNVVDVFVDKGDTFIKAGKNKGLKVGAEVQMLGDRIGDTDEYRSAGAATVMEVYDTIARVVPDDEAKKASSKRARIKSSGEVKVSPTPAPKTSPSPEPAPDAAPSKAGLSGRAVINGFGPAKQIRITNTGTSAWHSCDLRLPNNKRYKLSELRAGETESIILQRFSQDGIELDRPLDSITATCAEGTQRFGFAM